MDRRIGRGTTVLLRCGDEHFTHARLRPAKRGIRVSSVGFSIATGSPAASASLTAQRKAIGIDVQMLVGERKQVRALLLESGQEEKSCEAVSERPRVPDVRGSRSVA
jgi:hypothetical protein